MAAACLTATHWRVGLDKTFYDEPTRHLQRYEWEDVPNTAAAYISFKVTEGHANNAEATVSLSDEFDQVSTAYIHAVRPGIMGLYSKHPTVSFVARSHSRRKQADIRAAREFAEREQATAEFADGEANYATMSEQLAAGISTYWEKHRGSARVRARTDVEMMDGAHERSRRHRSKSGRKSRRSSSRRHRSRRATDGAEDAEGAGAGAGADAGAARSVVSRVSLRPSVAGAAPSVASYATDAETQSITAAKQRHYAYYVNGWIYSLVRKIVWRMGTQIHDEVVGGMMYIAHDVMVSRSFRDGLAELTEQVVDAKTPEEELARLIEQSSHAGEAWLPLIFTHTKHPSTAMDVCAADWSAPNYILSLASFDKIIVRSDRNTTVVKADGSQLADTDLKVRLVAQCVTLDPRENAWLVKNMHDIICVGHKTRVYKTGGKSGRSDHHLNIKWNTPTLSIHFMIVRQACIDDLDEFNGKGLFNEEPLVKARIMFGGRVRQPWMPAKFWRLVQPLEKGRATPRGCSYHWGAGPTFDPLSPEGSANMVRLTSATLDLELQPGLSREPLVITVYWRGFFLQRYEKGIVVPYTQMVKAAHKQGAAAGAGAQAGMLLSTPGADASYLKASEAARTATQGAGSVPFNSVMHASNAGGFAPDGAAGRPADAL